MAAVLRSLRAIPRPLALLLAATALLGIAWAVVVPPFQGPDESEHFAYVQHLAETGSIPSATTYSGAGTHASEQQRALDSLGLVALMGYEDVRPPWSTADQASWGAYERALPDAARKDGDGANPIAKNPPLYYAYAGVAYRVSPGHGLFARLLTARLAGVLLFVAIVALVWLAAAELTQRTWVRLLAAGTVALEPQLAFISGIVNADVLLVAIWTAFVTLTLRTVQRGPTTSRVLGLFALAALSPLTHGRGLALLPALAVVLALVAWRHRPPLRPALAWVGGGIAAIAGALLVVGLVGNTGEAGGALYGGQTNYVRQSGFSLPQLASSVWQFYLPALPGMEPQAGAGYGFRQMWIESFYGDFGWLDTRLPERLYDLLRLASVTGLGALVVALVARRRKLREQWPALVALAAIGGALVALAAPRLLLVAARLDRPAHRRPLRIADRRPARPRGRVRGHVAAAPARPAVCGARARRRRAPATDQPRRDGGTLLWVGGEPSRCAPQRSCSAQRPCCRGCCARGP